MDSSDTMDMIDLVTSNTRNDLFVDCYKNARDSFLQRTFLNYPDITCEELVIDIKISDATNKAPLIYAVLEHLPNNYYSVETGKVRISITNESDLANNIQIVVDLLTLCGAWRTLVISFNGVIIKRPELGYIVDYLFEKLSEKPHYYRRSGEELKKKYLGGRRHRSYAKEETDEILITYKDPSKALRDVIDKYVDKYTKNMDVCEYKISNHDFVISIEDNLIIDFRIMPRYWTRINDERERDWEFPYIVIQELTHNDLFKFNFAGFRRYFKKDRVGIGFYKFSGQHYYVKEIDNYDVVDIALPELHLQKRYKEYEGETYHFIILRIVDSEGNIEFGIGYTKGTIHAFVLKLCKELEEKNSRSLELNGASCLPPSENKSFINAFLSWKGKKKRWRLENQFSYFYVDRQIKDKIDLIRIPDELLVEAYKGTYDSCEFGEYSKPLHRWKSEELVYNLTKKLYKDYQVVFQYRPYFLQTDNGNMSYDVYICGLRIAIEYQGKQHFEPVEYFGGKDSFERQRERDKIKAELSVENGVKLVYINYWENITPSLIRKRIEEGISR